MAQGHGSIINVSTLSAVTPPSEPVYVVSKAALNMLAKVHAMEVGDQNVAVNAMSVLYLARTTPSEMSGEIIDAMGWNEANGHGGRDVWSWGA